MGKDAPSYRSTQYIQAMKTDTIIDCQIIIKKGEALIAERLAEYEARKAIDPNATPSPSIAKIRSNITRAKNKIAKLSK